MTRKNFILAALSAAILGGFGNALAQEFPTKPITIVVPYNPGGLPDALARLVGRKITENTGQPVIVENKPGASGIIGAQYFLSKAKPDGYTLTIVDDNTYAINPVVYPKLPYNPVTQLVPVTQAIKGNMYLVAHASRNIKSVRDLIAQAKARPSEINFGSPGNATQHHFALEQLGVMAGVKFTHVPYKGVTEANPALLRGDVAVMFATLTSVSANVKAGNLSLLAIAAPERSPLTPDVPTIAESGFPGFEVDANMGFAVPAGTPPEIVERLNAEMVKALKSPDLAPKIQNFGFDVVASKPEQFTAKLKKQRDAYDKLVRQIDFKLE